MDSKEITERILERRRQCMLSASHTIGQINQQVYDYCDRFSSGSEDIAVANDFFTKQST